MMKSKYTSEQLITLYRLSEQGVKGSELMHRSGVKNQEHFGKLSQLKAYLNGKPLSKLASKAMRDAVTTLRQEQLHSNNGVVKAGATPDNTNLKKLEEAFRVFQEAIVDVIVSEADRRSRELVVAKETDIAAQKEEYEGELQRLQAIIIQMKDSSVVGMIKRKWLQ